MSDEKGSVVTQASYEEQYGDMLLDGLCSTSTYIPLRTNKRLGINVAIRPMVLRVSEGVVLFGGKFRVGYTLEDGDYVKSKITAISDEARVQQLKDFCKGWTWLREDSRRSSTIVGIAFAASQYDRDSALEAIVDNALASEFLKRLDSTYQKYNDASFNSIRKAASALNDAWLLQCDSSSIFVPLPEVTQLPDSIIGEQTGVLNQAQEKYQGNVVSFQDKVNALKDAATESEEIDSNIFSH